MGIFKLFKKKKKEQPKSIERQAVNQYLEILSQFEVYEQQGWIAIAPTQHRVTVAQHLAALFSDNGESLGNFFRGLTMYATYQLTHIVTHQAFAKAELDAIAQKRQELGRDLTEEETKVAKIQAYADHDIRSVINRDIWFDIHVITPHNEPMVIARVQNGEVNILSVKEPEESDESNDTNTSNKPN